MLHEVLKIVTYLSIITTTTSSSYLSKESLSKYRRASPSSISNAQSSNLSNDGEGFESTELSNVESQSQSDYLIPQLVNVNNMLYTQLNSGNINGRNPKRSNSKKLSQRVRGKKDNNNKLINSKNNKLTNLIKNYDNLNKRNNIANSNSDESNNVRNATNSLRTTEENAAKLNLTSSQINFEPSHIHSALTNEYPINQISTETEHDRELQELFGFEGAKKYQNFQLQQQMLNANEQFPPTMSDDEGVELKEPQKKRNGEMNVEEMQDVSGAMVNQIMPRATRRQREYDVPLIREYQHLLYVVLTHLQNKSY